MEDRLISCNRDWTILTISDPNKNNSFYFNYSEINCIQFDEIYIKKIFRKVATERIQIFTTNNKNPIEFTKYYNQKYFDEYKQELTKFSKDNKIKLYDYVIS